MCELPTGERPVWEACSRQGSTGGAAGRFSTIPPIFRFGRTLPTAPCEPPRIVWTGDQLFHRVHLR
jgi:hypothetical protein